MSFSAAKTTVANQTPFQHRKCFFKRTRKGKIIRLVQEKYLRSDVECGYLFGRVVSQQDLCDIVNEAPHKQVIIIDTNIALHQIDALDHKCPDTCLVIVLQTVLQELKHLNLSVFKRLESLLKDESRSYIFYPNEFSAETAVLRNAKETVNDANDRAIRSSCLFFRKMLADVGRVVLITNDADNQRKAVEQGLEWLSMRGFIVKYLQAYPELLDLVANDTSSQTSTRQRQLYPAHRSMSEISAGLISKKYVRGTLRVKRDDWSDCYVVVHSDSGPRRSVQIPGRLFVNRTVDGDVVAVEIMSCVSESDRRKERELIRLGEIDCGDGLHVKGEQVAGVQEETLDLSMESVEGLESKVSVHGSEAASTESGLLIGRVVGVIRRNWRQYAGSLDLGGSGDKEEGSSGADQQSNSATSCLFYPVDKKMPPIRLSTRRKKELVGQRLLVAVDQWPADSLSPLGHYVRVLGKDGDKDVETQVLLHEFDVPNASFSADVLACLPPDGWAITEELIAQRTDLRHIPVVSIDPPGCKDIDDALHCIRLPNGNLEAGVHIADVSHFVHPDTAMDKEAAHRSTSTYLVERRLDMLPGLLTTELCSLRSKEDHLAFSVVWEMDDDANIIDVRFCKSAIHSVASLTYDEAQAMLDDPNKVDQVGSSVKLLNKLARILRQRRIDEGALTLASPEVRFKLDVETRNPTDVAMYALKESNALVEEWMLLANITVSKKMLRHYPTLSVLRRHQPPSREQFLPLMSAAEAIGVRLDITSSKTLADTLDLAVKPEDPYFNKLLRIMSTRCMMPAEYFCSGEIDKSQWHHYGLAAPVYTHFTSPIRRYADIIVHRLLSAAIGVIALPAANTDRGKQQDLATHMNRRHKAAQYAQRASVNLHTLLFFKNRPAVEDAYVLSTSPDKAVLIVPRFGIEGTILLEPLAAKINSRPESPEGSISSSVKFNSATHTVTIHKDGEGDSVGEEVLSMQVFQKVQVSIKVKEGRAGARRLVIGLVFNGVDYAEDSGDAANAGQVEEVRDEDDEDGEGDMMVVTELDKENQHEEEEDIMMLEKDEEEEGEEDDVPANAIHKVEKTVDVKDEPRNKRTKTSNASESDRSKVHAPVEVDVVVKKELKNLVMKSPAKSDEKKKKRQSLRK